MSYCKGGANGKSCNEVIEELARANATYSERFAAEPARVEQAREVLLGLKRALAVVHGQKKVKRSP